MRDLFRLNMTDFDPTVAFSADDSVEGSSHEEAEHVADAHLG